jgi:diacylglycerol kinase (ATP)
VPLAFGPAWDVICHGRETRVDVPRMDFQAPQPHTRWFIQMAGCGLDARAVELMDWGLKKRIGQFAYVISGLKALREPRPKLVVRDGSSEYRGELVLMCNGRLYGGSIPIFDRASLQDGLLDVLVFPRVNWLVVLRYALAFMSPRLITRGPERYLQAPSITVVHQGEGCVPVEVDGEAVGRLPVTCSVGSQVLRVVVP